MEHDNALPPTDPGHDRPTLEQLSWNLSQQTAWEAIVCGIQERKGGVVILGEAGTGKTTLMHAFMASVDPQYIKIIYIANTTITFPALVKSISHACGLDIHTDFLSDMLMHLQRLLANAYKTQRNVALILDNAHSFSTTIFANLWLLTQLKMADINLIQLVLLGQPELAQRLTQHASPSLRRHLAVCVTISPRLTTTEPLPIHQRVTRTVGQKMLPVMSTAWQFVVQHIRDIPPTLPQLSANVRTATRRYRVKLPVSHIRPLLAQAQAYRPFWRAPGILAVWARWQPRIGAAITTGHSRCHQAVQYSVQHAISSYTHLRRCWLAVRQAGRPVGVNLLAYTLRQSGTGAAEKLRFARGLPLALAGTAGLLLVASLLWYAQYPPEVTPPADTGATAAWQTPGLPAAPPPAVSTTTAPRQVATAAEAQLVIERLRARFGGGTPTRTPPPHGEHIRQIQTRLKTTGFSPGPIDGVLGPQTRQALRQFQKAKRLAATGELSQKTRQALGF